MEIISPEKKNDKIVWIIIITQIIEYGVNTWQKWMDARNRTLYPQVQFWLVKKIKTVPKGKENLLQKKMSSSPLASSLFPSSLSTLSAHNHGRSRSFCVSRKEQCLRVRAAKLPEGVNLLFYFPTNQYLKTKQTACCVVII